MSIQELPTRNRKIYAIWAIALTLLMTAALFCWLVVVPVLNTRDVLARYDTGQLDSAAALRELGGASDAAAKLATYLRLPLWMASHRKVIPLLLDHCVADAPEPTLRAVTVAMKDPDDEIRSRAIFALAMFPKREYESEVVELLISPGLTDPNSGVRLRAAHFLIGVGLKDPRRTATLVRALEDKEPEVRFRAAYGLASGGSSAGAAIPALIKALEDPLPHVRAAAARALGRISISTDAVISALEEGSNDGDPEVRSAATAALTKIREHVAK